MVHVGFQNRHPYAVDGLLLVSEANIHMLLQWFTKTDIHMMLQWFMSVSETDVPMLVQWFMSVAETDMI